MIQLLDKSFEILITKKEIKARIKQLASQLNDDYSTKKPLFIGVLNGSFIFAAALFKKCNFEAEITFIKVKSYENTSSTGKVSEIFGINENIEGRDIILVEDIVDTGLTINQIIKTLTKQNPKSLKIATLLFKPKALKVPTNPDYVGFEIEPKFVIGYGLDYDGLGRNLGDIWVLVD